MRLLPVIALSLGIACPAVAGVNEVLDDHILPSLSEFSVKTQALADAADRDCRPSALQPAFHDAFDAWIPVGDLRLGPSETGALSIAFWPDARGFTGRTLSRLIADADLVVESADAYAEVSIAARGLYALEMMLYDPEFSTYEADSYSCALTRAIASDMALQAAGLSEAWLGDFAETLRSAGEEGNATFLDEDEALRAIYTQILSSLEFTTDQRLARPLGTFDRPRPARAEARRSGRSLRNAVMASEAAHALASALAERDLPEANAALQRVHDTAERVSDAAFQDITDPQARLRVEALALAVEDLRRAIESEIGASLGIAPGFNAQDGD
ncbi:imelysin family protein [Lutimaribacter marinistellae]|uniref:Imelysin family protein n=1 Tax=Lutimaribacter marinistellae TaxID=1820329 RepID=A0ABV7TET3_9RHOB